MASPKNRGLGKGMDALFMTTLDKELIDEDKSRIRFVEITEVWPNKDQPRRSFNEDSLAELTSSIKRHGVLQPLIVAKDKSGFQIVAGERRYRASLAAGLKELPVIVRSLEELEKLEIALIENVQRVDLTPLDQARSIYRLHEQFSIEYAEIADRLGKAPTTISNIVRLLQLPEAAANALASGKITEGHARTILALAGKSELQTELLKKIINENWTVRQAEDFAKAAKSGKPQKQKKASANAIIKDDKLSQKLGLSVVVKKQKRGGQIIIKFSSQDELDSLTKNLLK